MDMKEKLAQEREARLNRAKPQAPDMNPDFNPRKPKQMKEPEPLPITIEELEANNEVSEDDMLTLRALVAQHVILGKEERAASDAKKPLTDRIKGIVQKTPALHKMLCAGGVVNFYPADRSSIKADKLLAQGVSPDTIAKATVTTTAWTLKIRDVADIEGE